MAQIGPRRLASWGRQGGWAVIDQATFAGSNFAVNVLLARWLTPVEYGNYAGVYAIFLLVGTVHTSLFTEPGSVLGASEYEHSFGSYSRLLLADQMRFGLLLGGLGLLTFTVLKIMESQFALSVLGMAIAAPFILLQWLTRRLAYVGFSAKLAAESGILYGMIIIAALILLSYVNLISPFAALVSLAIASSVSSLWIILRFSKSKSEKSLMVSEMRERHWNYGKWALMSNLLSWVPSNIFFPLFVHFNMAEEGARLRVLQTLAMPVLQFNGALATLFLPKLTRVRATEEFGIYVRLALLSLMTVAGVGTIIIGLWGNQIAQWLLGSHYVFSQDVLWIAGIVPISAAASSILTAVLRATQNPQQITQWYALIAFMTLLVASPILHRWGGIGALAWSGTATAILALGSAFSWWRLSRKNYA